MNMKLKKGTNHWQWLPIFLVFLISSASADEIVVTANDADGDRIVDTIDVDDDNDGILDVEEISADGRDIDSDHDGIPNRLDLDSDNDGILDWRESGAVIEVDFSGMRVVSGRILGKVGLNGFIDTLETSVDSGVMRYTLLNSDSSEDDIPDVLDLDSDNDGLTDLREAGVDPSYDADNDARIDIDKGSAAGGVGNDGIPDRLQQINDELCCDVNGDGIEDSVPRNTDLADLPDFQDLDSDNDGVLDLVEAGGSDFDGNGRVDNFFDSPVVDGMDDTILLIPFESPDNNGNAVPDFIDPFAQAGGTGTVEQPTNTPAPDTDGSTDDDQSEDDQGDNGPVANDPGEDDAGEDDPGATVIRDPVERPGSAMLTGADSQPLEDDSANGFVNTGLSASGCSVQSAGIDLIVLLLSVFSIAILGWRYTLRRLRI